MKVFNLTDVATATLERQHLMHQHFAVGGRMVDPGQYVEVADTPEVRENLFFLLTVGAVAIDTLPPPYVKARELMAAQKGHLSGIPVRHLNVQETKVAVDEPAALPESTGTPASLERHDPQAEESDERKGKKTKR